MGVSWEESEVALNHKLGELDEIYDVREERPERREALEKWCEFIVACETGAPTPAFVKPTQGATSSACCQQPSASLAGMSRRPGTSTKSPSTPSTVRWAWQCFA